MEKLVAQLHGLVDAGNTVVVVEHDMAVVAGSDWVIDIGPGAGEEGGRVVCAGPPPQVAKSAKSRTAPYLARVLGEARRAKSPVGFAGGPGLGERRGWGRSVRAGWAGCGGGGVLA